MDGLRGPLIVHDPNSPYKGQYDSEIVMYLSDWYHEQAAIAAPQYVGKKYEYSYNDTSLICLITAEVSLNPNDGSEPVPNSALMNDQINPHFAVQPNKTYFLRIINLSGFAQFYLHIPGHNFTIIETDSIYTHPTFAQDLYIANGQRYGVLLKTLPKTTQNYPILGTMDPSGFDPDAMAAVPDLQQNVTGALVYDSKYLPTYDSCY